MYIYILQFQNFLVSTKRTRRFFFYFFSEVKSLFATNKISSNTNNNQRDKFIIITYTFQTFITKNIESEK